MNRLLARLLRRNVAVEPEAAQSSREPTADRRARVIELDEEGRVLSAGPLARELVDGLAPGARLAVRAPGEEPDYRELRAAFTAAVSHELRTPLARLLSLLETALLPGSDRDELVERARREVDEMRELIDDVLFLSELETGREVVGLTPIRGLPIVRDVAASFAERAARAGVTVRVEGDEHAEIPLRERMLRVTVANLVENAVRYAGPDTTLTLSLRTTEGAVELNAADDGAGVSEDELPRLFERFYRGDRARASRGTGLGLAIVKHVVTAAGAVVEARRSERGGLTVRCIFPR